MHAPTLPTTEPTTICDTLLPLCLYQWVHLCVCRSDLSVAMLFLQPFVPSSCWCLMDFMRCVVLSLM